ncbi:MAG: response regulator [Oscillospiraceae bacterium]|nr:response regulator [Oscillospiraceae bacterium]
MNNSNKKIPDVANVLVVDDNVILLRTVKEMLDSNYNVSIATSGEQAFKSISRKRPDVILLDYEMPEMNGEDVIKQLREDEATANIPVLFLTSSANREVVKKLIMLNPDGYMLKPPNKQSMIEHIEEVLHKEE